MSIRFKSCKPMCFISTLVAIHRTQKLLCYTETDIQSCNMIITLTIIISQKMVAHYYWYYSLLAMDLTPPSLLYCQYLWRSHLPLLIHKFMHFHQHFHAKCIYSLKYAVYGRKSSLANNFYIIPNCRSLTFYRK